MLAQFKSTVLLFINKNANIPEKLIAIDGTVICVYGRIQIDTSRVFVNENIFYCIGLFYNLFHNSKYEN